MTLPKSIYQKQELKSVPSLLPFDNKFLDETMKKDIQAIKLLMKIQT